MGCFVKHYSQLIQENVLPTRVRSEAKKAKNELYAVTFRLDC